MNATAAAEPFHFTTRSVERGQTVDIRNINGDVTVVPGDRVEIDAVKTSKSGNADAVRIIATQTDRGVSACVRYPGDDRTDCAGGGRGGRRSGDDNNDTVVTFTARVPRGVNVVAASVNGNVAVRSDALVRATTVNGKITVDAGDVSSAATVNGAIDVRVHDARSDAPLDVRTVNGSLTCTLPASAGVTLSADVFNGDIDAGGLAVKRPQYGPGASVNGTLGDGKRRVRLKTLNGSVRLVRA